MVGLDNHTRWNMSGGGGTIVNVSAIRQPWYGLGRKTVVKKAKDVRMQWTGCRDFRNDVCETLCHAQTPNWKTVKTQTQKEKSQENCNRDCSIVRGQQLGRKMDQRPMRDGKKYKDKIG